MVSYRVKGMFYFTLVSSSAQIVDFKCSTCSPCFHRVFLDFFFKIFFIPKNCDFKKSEKNSKKIPKM